MSRAIATIVLDLEEDHFIQVRAINCAGESDNTSMLVGTYDPSTAGVE